MSSGDIATTINRLKNIIVDYDNLLIKASNILQTFDQKKHDRRVLFGDKTGHHRKYIRVSSTQSEPTT
jgi:hypothetical protein